MGDIKKNIAFLIKVRYPEIPWMRHSGMSTGNAVALQYGVRGVPQNYLIDPDGKIVASNLRDERLHTVLAEIMGSL